MTASPSRSPLRLLSLLMAVLALSTGCLKEEKALPAGGEAPVLIEQGEDYGNTVFFKLGTAETHSAPVNSWDLAFPADLDSMAVRVNSGKLILAWNSRQAELTDSLPPVTTFDWQTDAPHGQADSTALWGWHDESAKRPTGHTFVIDRGSLFHKDDSTRYVCLQILGRDAESFTIRWARRGAKEWKEQRVALDRNYTHAYFSFDDGGKTVLVAPTRDRWDLQFTQYIFPFDELPPPGRWYLVRGALQNVAQGVEAAAVTKDFDQFPKYESLTRNDLPRFQFSRRADAIGYDWKYFDLQGSYFIRPDNYYLAKDPDGVVYRLRFIDYYDDKGRKGFPQFVYEAL